jgi:hypothetical protein
MQEMHFSSGKTFELVFRAGSHIQRLQHHIFKFDIEIWWEIRCDEFIFEEIEL